MTPSDLTPSGTRSARDWSAATLGSGVAQPPAAPPPPPPEEDEPPPHPVSANATLVRASAAMAVRRIGVLRDKGGLLLRDRTHRSCPARVADGAPGHLAVRPYGAAGVDRRRNPAPRHSAQSAGSPARSAASTIVYA